MTQKFKSITIALLVIGMIFPLPMVFALEMQDPSAEESFDVTIADSVQNHIPAPKEVIGQIQSSFEADSVFWTNTFYSFAVSIVLATSSIYAYFNVIKDKRLNLFGTHKKEKIQKIPNV